MQANAIVFQQPKSLDLSALTLPAMGAEDVLVKVEFSGISTGTERLLWEARCRPFRAWATPWCLATKPSGASWLPVTGPI